MLITSLAIYIYLIYSPCMNDWPSGAWVIGFQSHVRSCDALRIAGRVSHHLCFYTVHVLACVRTGSASSHGLTPAPSHRDRPPLENTCNQSTPCLSLIGEGRWVASALKLERHASPPLLCMQLIPFPSKCAPMTKPAVRVCCFSE